MLMYPPAPGVRVICVDEIEQITVTTYFGEEWKTGTKRAAFDPSSGVGAHDLRAGNQEGDWCPVFQP